MKRIIYGLVFLFFALLLVRTSSFGALGHFVATTFEHLLGAAGVALLTLVLLVVAFQLLVPKSIRRWLLSFPTLFEREPAAPVQVMKPARRRAPPRQQLVIVTGADLQNLGLQGLMTAMNGGLEAPQAPPQLTARPAQPIDVVAPEPELPYEQRRRRSDVTSALKQLQFTKGEYEPVLAKMDFTRPSDELLREAILALRRPDVARVVRPS